MHREYVGVFAHGDRAASSADWYAAWPFTLIVASGHFQIPSPTAQGLHVSPPSGTNTQSASETHVESYCEASTRQASPSAVACALAEDGEGESEDDPLVPLQAAATGRRTKARK
jgi:hypothetical protein